MQETCADGDTCYFAHSGAELRPNTAFDRDEAAEHWMGTHVSIGIVERALFWDVPPLDTADIVCNRCSCLGNPFGSRIYRPDEEMPPKDEKGWCHGEHQYLCESFAEYLDAVLDTDSEDTLEQITRRLCKARSLTLAETWVAQELERRDILRGLENVKKRMINGQRIRLLCHCRPFVRCHCETLKLHLEKCIEKGSDECQFQVDTPWEERMSILAGLRHEHMRTCPWPGSKDFGPECAAKKCTRSGRAYDPGSNTIYCAQCWAQLYKDLQWMAERIQKGQPHQWSDTRQQKPQRDFTEPKPGTGPPCRFFKLGYCKYGEHCYFTHTPAPEGPSLDSTAPQKRKSDTGQVASDTL